MLNYARGWSRRNGHLTTKTREGQWTTVWSREIKVLQYHGLVCETPNTEDTKEQPQ